MKQLFTWFFTSIGVAIIGFFGKLIDLYERIDVLWYRQPKEKKKNIRNNFQKASLVAICVFVKIYGDLQKDKAVNNVIFEKNKIVRLYNECRQNEFSRLKKDNKELDSIKNVLHDTKITVEILKQQQLKK